MEARWGGPPAELDGDHPAWELEAHYLALGLVSAICILSPQRIILGGGVMSAPGLIRLVRREISSVLNGYLQKEALAADDYLTPPALGNRSGVLGAIVLAESLE